MGQAGRTSSGVRFLGLVAVTVASWTSVGCLAARDDEDVDAMTAGVEPQCMRSGLQSQDSAEGACAYILCCGVSCERDDYNDWSCTCDLYKAMPLKCMSGGDSPLDD